MRLRNIKGSREAIEASSCVVKDITAKKSAWEEFFGNNNPIHIEIGMGKGKFIMELARNNPNINFIGIEKYSSVLIRAIEKASQEELSNLYFIRMDAESITDVFDQGEIDKIYLNFSDPWPKEKHAKRRLTSKEFFARYHQILAKDGDVTFKTDNRELFDFSVEQIPLANWNIRNITYDLHNSEFVEGNIMTEYEVKFVSEGKPIHRLVAYR